MSGTTSRAPSSASDVLAEDRLLWQFWINKGMKEEPLRAGLADMPAGANWDYVAGNAMYGGFEADLLGFLRRAGRAPEAFIDRLARDAAGDPHPVTLSSDEGRLLVRCASPRMTREEDARARALARGSIEWNAVVAAAARANLTAAVMHNFARLGIDELMPAEAARVMRARDEGIRARNRRLMSLLDGLCETLSAHGIRVLLLKESALALSHYGNGRLRMMGDIDLLLGDGEVDAVESLLDSQGYEVMETVWTKEHYRQQHHHAAPMVQLERAVKIEPHFTIPLPVEAPAGLVDSMAERAVRVDAHRWCFDPTDMLFHLCMDLFGNAFIGKMGQLCDAREVVRQGGVEWPRLVRTAQECGAEGHLAFSLGLLSEIDTPVPHSELEQLEKRRLPFEAARLKKMSARNLFGYVPATAVTSRPGERLLFASWMRPGSLVTRMVFMLRRYLYFEDSDKGMGELARRSRPTRGQALTRLMTLPFRALRRWTASRRIP